MIGFPVRQEKLKDLQNRMKQLGILEEDLEEGFVRSSGKGGQKLHKTDNCIFLRHKPSGISIKCQESRSQALNRFLARRRLVEKIEQQLLEGRDGGSNPEDKIRKQKKRRKRRARKKVKQQGQDTDPEG